MLKKKIDIIAITHFLYEIGTLRKVPRSHMQTLLTSDLSDNIASHSYRVSVIGYLLSYLENADANKVVIMCLFHDSAESRSGDQNWVHKKYVKTFEDEIITDQLINLPMQVELTKIINEYRKRQSPESRIAKDADLLDQILLLREYWWQGNQEVKKWSRGKEQEKRLLTKSAKLLAKEIFNQEPNEWWDKEWTATRRS